MMRVWIIKLGEPLPTDAGTPRLLRAGMLAEALAARGHEVMWWTSTVDHMHKCQRSQGDFTAKIFDNYHINVLKVPLYTNNVSLRRIRSHRAFASRFRTLASCAVAPDIVVASLPTTEAVHAAALYCGERHIPLVVDVRDLWPDLITDSFPRWSRPVVRAALEPMYRQVRHAMAHAAAIVGVTPAYVDWGLRYAGRASTQLDRAFPMAYRPADGAVDAVDDANEFWARRGVSPDPAGLTCCFFGTFGRQFDIGTVIDAARCLRATHPQIRFVLCGAGDRLDSYRAAAEGLDNVLFPGWVNSREIWALMKMSHVGLAPYVNIPNFVLNLPNKPVEYLCAGLPIVTCLDGYLRELVEKKHCGATYRAGSGTDLANTLVELHSNREQLAAMRSNALRVYAEEFRADVIWDAYVSHLVTVRDAYHESTAAAVTGDAAAEAAAFTEPRTTADRTAARFARRQ